MRRSSLPARDRRLSRPPSCVPQGDRTTRVLLVVDGPAYGADESCDALRPAVALAERDDAEPTVFLMGDAVTCAVSGQHTPDGFYELDRMSAEATRSTTVELAAFTVEADRVLTF